MTSKTESVLQSLATLIDAGTTAAFERNASVPEKIPPEGLVILRDGNPGVADEALGGFDPVYYEHETEIEIYVADGAQSGRDTLFDTIVTDIGTALSNNPDLSGAVYGITYSRPDVTVEIIPGSHAIKSGVIPLVLDYESQTPLT